MAHSAHTAFSAIMEYLSRPDIREMLGVDPSVPSPFEDQSMDVLIAFMYKGLDLERTAVAHVAALLERGIRILIYTGIDGVFKTRSVNDAALD